MAKSASQKQGVRGPPRIMVTGLGGTGKSSLVKRLFELEESVAEERCGGGTATTLSVQCHHHQLKNGNQLILFDTPGFDDPEIGEHRIIADMKLKTDGYVDLLLYCISLEKKGARVTLGDTRVISLLTRVFGSALWKKAILVVTFANKACKRHNMERYNKLVETIHENLCTELQRKAHVPQNIASRELPFVTAGYNSRIIQPHEKEDWVQRLHDLIHQKNPDLAGTLFKKTPTIKDVLLTAAGVGGGIGSGIAGVSAGAGIGAAVGSVGGPVGTAVGGILGGAIGTAVAGGATTGVVVLMKKDQLQVWWEKRKLIKLEQQQGQEQLQREEQPQAQEQREEQMQGQEQLQREEQPQEHPPREEQPQEQEQPQAQEHPQAQEQPQGQEQWLQAQERLQGQEQWLQAQEQPQIREQPQTKEHALQILGATVVLVVAIVLAAAAVRVLKVQTPLQ